MKEKKESIVKPLCTEWVKGFTSKNCKINLYYYEDNLQMMLMENLQLEILVRKQNK